MDFVDINFDEHSKKFTLIYSNGTEKTIEKNAVKKVFVLNQNYTPPIHWYHRFIAGLILIVFFIITIYQSLTFLDSEELDYYPVLSEFLFYLVLLYTIISLVVIALMIHFGITNGGKFISYYTVKMILSKRKKYFIIATARKEYKIHLKNRKQVKEYQLKAVKIRNIHLS